MQGHRLALGVAYDGSDWHGWQKQPHGRTIQNQLEQALSSFLAQPVTTICAGRTDAGVHALEQIVHLDTTVQRAEHAWVRGLNSYLPNSIRVQWAHRVGPDFHARFGAQKRHYIYILRNAAVPSPFAATRMGWVFRPLSLEPMQQAAQLFVGTHDFSAFRSAECQAHSPIRSIEQLQIVQQGDILVFYFCANAFLHHMIRNMMGTLIAIGLGRQPVHWVEDLLKAKDRRAAAPTFSPAGLYLAKVDYAANWGLPSSSIEQLLHTHLGLSYGKV